MTNNNLQTIHPGSKPGKITIGDTDIPCFVLEDGTRILSEHGVTRAMKSRSGASKRRKKMEQKEGRAPLPVFMSSNNLNPYISEDLRIGLLNPIKFRIGNRVAQGYLAELLPKVCEVWLKARDEGVLNRQQLPKCKQAEILMRGLAHVGIIALVDEATDFQEIRDKLALQKILELYIAKELRPWVKTFQDDFYENLFRLRGWQYHPLSVKRPIVVGRITNDLIYRRLAPKILDELKTRTPRDEKGRTRHRYFQWLTDDIGHPKLREHLASVTTLMKASPNWAVFYRLVQRALPQYGKTLELPFTDKEIEKMDVIEGKEITE
jgi:hypothetical protein